MPLSTIDSTGLANPLTGINSPTVVGNLTFSTSNAGIVFNNSSALVNSTLNDYEKGTWTPVDVSGVGVSISSNGNYIKVGTQVVLFFSIAIPSVTNAASVKIGGFPFTTGNPNAGSDVGFGGLFTFNNRYSGHTVYVGLSSTFFYIYNISAQQSYTTYSSTNIEGFITYLATF